jgi:hypothetical protein
MPKNDKKRVSLDTLKMFYLLCINDTNPKIKEDLDSFKQVIKDKVITITEPRYIDEILKNMRFHSKYIHYTQKNINFLSMCISNTFSAFISIVTKKPDWKETFFFGFSNGAFSLPNNFNFETASLEKNHDDLARILGSQLIFTIDKLKEIMDRKKSMFNLWCDNTSKIICKILEKSVGHLIVLDLEKQLNDSIKNNRKCKSCSNKFRITKVTKNNKKYTKLCTICKNKTIFSTYTKYKNSKKDDEYKCKSCSVSLTHKNKKITEEHKFIISNTTKKNWNIGKYINTILASKIRWSGINNPQYNSNRTGNLNPFFGKTHSKETIEKIKKSIKEKLTDERRAKMSESAKARIIKFGNPKVNYNPKSIPIIEEYGKKYGYNFQHAENGGEYIVLVNNKCYHLDGYDIEKNVVIEYYENHHKYTIEKDESRKKEIINKLNCSFIEIKEWELK